MSGIVGLTSSKIALVASTVCLQARADLHSVAAELDWNAPRTVLSEKLTDHLRPHRQPYEITSLQLRPMFISIGAEEVKVTPVAASSNLRSACGAIDIAIGGDVLWDNPILLDLRKRQIRLILPYEAARYTKRRVPVPLEKTVEGWVVQVSTPSGPARAKLDLSAATNASGGGGGETLVTLGPITKSLRHIERETHAGLTMGLDFFDGEAVLIDLAHARLWIDESGARRRGM